MGKGSDGRPGNGRARGPILSRLLLDTTFLIDADRAGDGLDEAVGDDDDVAIAAITVAELRAGVLLSSGKHQSDRLAFLRDVLDCIPVVDYDLRVAEAHAELLVYVRRRGRPRGAHDLIIAATAKAGGRKILSAREASFGDLPGIEVQPHRSPGVGRTPG